MHTGFRHVQTLVELAALTAHHGNTLLSANAMLSRSGIESYWLASRNRLDAWSIEMKRLETICFDDSQFCLKSDDTTWHAIESLNEEIMASEILTRVWATLGCAVDKRTNTNEAEPFVRSVFNGHVDARHRMMRLAFEKMDLPAVRARKTDRVRRLAEKWTDILLGFVDASCDTSEFAFETERVTDFASSVGGHAHPDLAQSLIMVSLKSAFENGFANNCPNASLNRQISASVLSCFSPDVFDSVGVFKSLWQTRMANVAKDTQGMLDALIMEHEAEPIRWSQQSQPGE